jgi:hypothetical protein
MKIKKLNWCDNVTKQGKLVGLFQIKSSAERINIYYSIQNNIEINNIYDDKFFLVCDDEDYIECSSVEEAKNKAQEHFNKKILELFFEE